MSASAGRDVWQELVESPEEQQSALLADGGEGRRVGLFVFGRFRLGNRLATLWTYSTPFRRRRYSQLKLERKKLSLRTNLNLRNPFNLIQTIVYCIVRSPNYKTCSTHLGYHFACSNQGSSL